MVCPFESNQRQVRAKILQITRPNVMFIAGQNLNILSRKISIKIFWVSILKIHENFSFTSTNKYRDRTVNI